ncbi:hypothetical protein [Pseudoxanthomonas winnipegensis]|uniref:Uncharacterized protein n=1 Tax=Pseudoxanthomonas winnipegensis TaxID=2480810 RepID=A0A4Q8L7S6_9GAMM|nr:hypothetical protein [Pseudoxanthomonas winnipegensis]RZZ81322.1 hypothetical protein EA662_18430 [Pseudoxanthomonas winnipegensis]TAA24214.1 hypothetical protein EA661_19230 [Pseudoxanthomonas winnipegensis]TAA36872.1 hypothetical protein EAT51_18960 [Pseudoxanthomonas winnipegensis]TBV74870.1 hypothetical protein EYC46_11445 [Pseudoxanthomonas winnipegensis]
MTTYYIALPDPEKARGPEPEFSFTSSSAEGYAQQLQDALRTDVLFARWRDAQDEPDQVPPSLGAVDPAAHVQGKIDDLHIDLVVDTSLPSEVLKHRLGLLAGSGWRLHDVR